MATSFPTSLQDLDATRGTTGQTLASPNHITHHALEDDTLEALQAKVGADSSAVTTSHDYKLSGVTGTDKAVSKTGTETLTNKTLTTPVITTPTITLGSDAAGDMYYRHSDGTMKRLPKGNDGDIIVYASGVPSTGGLSNASTTQQGLVELATQAEADAATATGGTGAKLVVTPDIVRARLLNTGVADTGSANAVAIAPTPAITAYATYQEFRFKAAATNTGATTINVNSLGTKNIYFNGVALSGGEIAINGIYTVIYDGTQFQLISNSSKGGGYFPQKVGFGTFTPVSDPRVSVTAPITGADSSNPFYVALAGASTIPNLIQVSFDAATNSAYYTGINSQQSINVGTTMAGMCILGSYLYYGGAQNGGSTYQCRRQDLGTLANDTNLTISGTAPAAGNSAYNMFTDGTYLYINDGTTQTTIKKYSVSGTTITYVSSITFTSMVATYSTWCDGTNVYQFYADGSIGKWALAGGARTSITGRDFGALTNTNASTGIQGIFGIAGNSKMMVIAGGTEARAGGSTVQNNYLQVQPITYQ